MEINIDKRFLVLAGFILLFFVGISLKDQLAFSFSKQSEIDPDLMASDFDLSASRAVFDNKELNIPNLLASEEGLKVLGETNLPKRIEVDLTKQLLYAYEGDRQVYNFLISSGKWGRTPTGTFQVWTKLRYTRMKGGSQLLGTYYDLPNVPYTMFFYNQKVTKAKGFGIHGAYWHNNFGRPMSHGCINMKIEDAGLLFYWAHPDLKGKNSILISDDNPGTEIIIYGKAPAV